MCDKFKCKTCGSDDTAFDYEARHHWCYECDNWAQEVMDAWDWNEDACEQKRMGA